MALASFTHTRHTLVLTTHAGRRGHPTWLQWSHFAVIRALPPDQGLNAFIRARTAETRELPWPSDEILRDLDTPEDYQRLLHPGS
jgi:CTP:molybdopterin cytidylyltransferase MocA